MPELDRREAILIAALARFSERGFHGAAVPDLADRAGVASGTIYRYFPSKEALANALFQRWKTELGQALMNDFPFDAPVREQFHVFWQRMAAFARAHRQALQFLELHDHRTYLDATSRELEETVLGTARCFFDETRRSQATKDLRSEVLIALVWGAFMGLVRATWLGYLELDDATLAEGERCAWEAIRA